MKDYVFFHQPAVRKLMQFIQAGGPEESEYEEMTNLWDALKVDQLQNGADGQSRKRLLDLFGQDFLYQTIHGHSFRKPHGYAGDYEIIDLLYQQKVIAPKKFEKWDKYIHSLHATRAVRNRKDYFIQLIKEKTKGTDKPIRILNIASGPCRDVYELFKVVSPERIELHCIDHDADAIHYAKNILGDFSEHVQFTRANIFKFETSEKYDLIWSGGLFDYFHDADFQKILSKIYSWCTPNGEIVIGNFSVENPTRSVMEKAYDWFLHHRTKERLGKLALEVALPYDTIEVKSEALRVNLFLHIQRNCNFLA